MNHENLLKKLYYDPKFGLQGKAKFIQKVRKQHPEIPRKEIASFVDKQQLQQINKPINTNFKGSFKIVDIPRTFQVDVMFLPAYKSTNNNISAFLICIDILSRKMFMYPLKNKTIVVILDAIKQLHKDVPDLKGLSGDMEFAAKAIENYCQDNNIMLQNDVSNDVHVSKGSNKLGIVDVACKTIKRRIRNYILANKTTKYINKLQDLVDNYNTSIHSSLQGHTPNEIFEDFDFQRTMYEALMEHNKKLQGKIDLQIGDYVRKAVDKKIFDKENITFSPEVFVIADVIGYQYKLIDEDGVEQKRKYKYFELMKVDESEIEGNASDENIKEAKKIHKTVLNIQKENEEQYDKILEDVKKLGRVRSDKVSSRTRSQPKTRANSVNTSTRITRSGKNS